MKKTRKLLTLSALGGLLAPGAYAQFNKLEAWGDAAGTTPAPSFTSGGGASTISAGGADFWGGSDQGAYLWDTNGNMTRTGDFTASVRHVSTNSPAPEWGRDGILVRAISGGAPAANDPNWLAMRKSNGQIETGRRETIGGGTELGPLNVSDLGGINSGNVATTGYFLAAARDGNTMRASAAMDMNGTPGRWVETGASNIAAFAAGKPIVFGLGHQSHAQSGGGAGNGGVNTASFDSWSTSGNYDRSKFGAASGATTWNVGGALTINSLTGAVRGSAYTQEGGQSTFESTKWTIRAVDKNSFVPVFGVAGAGRNGTAMETQDIVPASNFRVNSTTTGLTANIYTGTGNPGNINGVRNILATKTPNGTTIIPNVDWTGADGTSPTNATQYNRGEVGDFSVAVPGQFTGGNQEDYGVHMTGEIWIPGDADRKGSIADAIKFKDGIDDYTYLAVDGKVLLNDNDWTGYNSVDNGGSHASAMDVSDSKFDDGEWVSFEMVAWEGGGGDAGVLYWDANDVNGTFTGIGVPTTPTNVITATGYTQIGTEDRNGAFAVALPDGTWGVSLTVENTGASAVFNQSVTVVPEPTSALLVMISALGFIVRRRR